MKYCDFIDGINSGIIKKASFSIEGYSHYRNCIVESTQGVIWFHLTPDGYEKKGFLHQIKEDAKLFHIRNKGSFSLRQLWDKVNIHFIEYEGGQCGSLNNRGDAEVLISRNDQ